MGCGYGSGAPIPPHARPFSPHARFSIPCPCSPLTPSNLPMLTRTSLTPAIQHPQSPLPSCVHIPHHILPNALPYSPLTFSCPPMLSPCSLLHTLPMLTSPCQPCGRVGQIVWKRMGSASGGRKYIGYIYIYIYIYIFLYLFIIDF